jgi:hypothetical protein
MKFEMKMPDLAATDSAIKVLNWLIEVGNPVRQGQAVIEVEEYGVPMSTPDAEITPALPIEKAPASVLSPPAKKGDGLFSRNRAARKNPSVRDELFASTM